MKKLLYLFLSLSLGLAFNSCSDDDGVTLQTISVNFASSEIGIDTEENSQDVTINLSRLASAATTVEISYTAYNVDYSTHFTINPAPDNNKITVTVPAGQSTHTFTVSKTTGVLFDGDEYITFKIESATSEDDVKVGDRTECKLSFGTILSQGDVMTLEGNGEDGEAYVNSVYVDFSSNKQTVANRKSWNLGFHCGNEFKVILNGAYATAATPSAKTDINDVTVADAEALEGTDFDLNVNTMGGTFSETIFDSSDGSLTGTAFATISANSNENFVYFVASADNKTTDRGDWYKVKVDRNGNGYTVQYAKVSETTINTVEVPKKAGYNLTFLSLESGNIVDVEPEAEKWDIKWSYDSGYSTSMATAMYMAMQDFVTINYMGGASVATVSTDNIINDFNSFTKADLAGLEFSSDRDAIGDTWRSTMGGMNGAAAGILYDRFYVVKDPSGNYYKMKFNKMGLNSDGGVRGRPEVEYALVD